MACNDLSLSKTVDNLFECIGKLCKMVNGRADETVILGGVAVSTLRGQVKSILDRWVTITYRGGWAEKSGYVINDVVLMPDGTYYRSIRDHTSSGSVNDDIAAGFWVPFSSQDADSIFYKYPAIPSAQRLISAKLSDLLSVKDFGAKGDGVTDDTIAIQNCFDDVQTKGGGRIFFPMGNYLISEAINVGSHTHVSGSSGATTITHPVSHGFHNRDLENGDTDIEISGFIFDDAGTCGGSIAFEGCSRVNIHHNRFINTQDEGITVGIGIAAIMNKPCSEISITDNSFDVSDYGIVLHAYERGTATISKITISGNQITTSWGSGISFAGNVSDVSITGNVINLPGDSPHNPNVGIGVKLWQGTSLDLTSTGVTISGNAFSGAGMGRPNLTGISAANWAQNIVVTGNTFRNMTNAFYSGYAGTGASGITFADNMVRNCDDGYLGATSTDVEPVITGNTFINCGYGIRSTLSSAVVSGNKFLDIVNNAIYGVTPTRSSAITGNVFKNIGKEAVVLAGDTANNVNNNITQNTFTDCCISADATYNVVQLNTQQHSISGNFFINNSATVKPKYLIGDTMTAEAAAYGNRRLFHGNWMFGARLDYIQHVGTFDVDADNLRRGGIS